MSVVLSPSVALVRNRVRWQSARRHLTLVSDGGLLLPGEPVQTFRTAPLPDGVAPKLWEQCGCDYRHDGPRKTDPAFTDWSEDPARTSGKLSLRYALSDPRTKSDGGLLGPNFYRLGHFHSGDARHDAPGYPDLTIWGPGGREVWELKIAGAVPTLPQAVHMTALELYGFTVRLVRPCCLLSGWVDRWLGVLAGVAPALSAWAPTLAAAPTGRPAPRLTIPATTLSTAAPRRLQLVPAPPGRDYDPADTTATGVAVGYLVPMPTTGRDVERGALEAWLREHGFGAADVPWPMRLAIVGALLVVWANTGEPASGPGQPRPRQWRAASLNRDVPEDLLLSLGAETLYNPSMPVVLGLLQRACSSALTS